MISNYFCDHIHSKQLLNSNHISRPNSIIVFRGTSHPNDCWHTQTHCRPSAHRLICLLIKFMQNVVCANCLWLLPVLHIAIWWTPLYFSYCCMLRNASSVCERIQICWRPGNHSDDFLQIEETYMCCKCWRGYLNLNWTRLFSHFSTPDSLSSEYFINSYPHNCLPLNLPPLTKRTNDSSIVRWFK